MIIQSHDVNLHSLLGGENYTKGTTSLTMNRTPSRNTVGSRATDDTAAQADDSASVLLSLSSRVMEQFQKEVSIDGSFSRQEGEIDEEMQLPSKLQMARKLMETFFGIKVEIINPDAHKTTNSKHPASNAPAPTSGENPSDIEMTITHHEVRYHKENVLFNANGSITTEDGRELNFNIDMQMSKETYEEITFEVRTGSAANNATDPLALNFDGKGVELTDEKYSFDLDSDGQMEQISFLKQGSGFLVFDRNQNGIADNGSELFGPQTNNGFSELKAYDEDNSDWIDENDSIFYKLSIWTKDESGTDQLTSLKEHNVGAIYLNSADTRFQMEQGQLRESGVFLQENGEANLIQELDLFV